MKTLVVLAEHPDFVESVRTAIDARRYRVLSCTGAEEAEPLLVHGLAEACILDVGVSKVQGIWLLEKLRRRAPKCPIIVFTETKGWEWEEEAYLQGAAHVLSKPVRGRLLVSLLERLLAGTTPGDAPAPAAAMAQEPPKSLPAPADAGAGQSLGVLRDFSGILIHSLNAEAMLKEFLLLLREILGINRGAIFLRQPPGTFGGAPTPAESRGLRAACAIGLSAGLLQHLELSFDAGIGGQLRRLCRILRRNSDEARADIEAQKEFELLGAQVAIPILDRETVLGAAVFDGRITGEPLANSELELIFHLLEQLGLAIKNIWLHDQLAGNHEMLTDILRELSSACVVVGRDLTILHANKMARKHFGPAERRGGEFEFSDLPQFLGGKVYQVLKTGTAITNLKYEPEQSPGTIYHVSIVPFQAPQGGPPGSALLMADDLTQSGQLQKLEIEAAKLRLVQTMAERLTHEIGNALVPISTHQQLLAERLAKKNADLDYLKVMERDWADSVRRVTRLVSQMRYLARETLAAQEAFPLAPLLEEAYQEARKYQPVKAQLRYDEGQKAIMVTGDRMALKHALAEVMLNALQANPADPKVGVRLNAEANGDGSRNLQIEVQDNGSGFTPEAARNASVPFFTTRNVGLGLGLAVSRKIIETHQGKLEIIQPKSGRAGVVRISLPLRMVQTAQER